MNLQFLRPLLRPPPLRPSFRACPPPLKAPYVTAPSASGFTTGLIEVTVHMIRRYGLGRILAFGTDFI
jgi:hypothetical protein